MFNLIFNHLISLWKIFIVWLIYLLLIISLCVIMEYISVIMDNFADYNDIIHDYLAKGFALVSYDEKSVYLKKNNYGSFKNHLLLFIFTIWWSFGLVNILYLVYSYFQTAEKYRIVFDAGIMEDIHNRNSFNYNFSNSEYITQYLCDDKLNKSDSSNDNQSDSSLPIVRFLEDWICINFFIIFINNTIIYILFMTNN